ncbi:MAG: hypothetical protein U9Q66_04550, partial [Patescibacteria group bacterium]|nr:hypothetical protein [Patescibacteria group bacterium]
VLQFIAMIAVPVLFITFGYLYKPEYLDLFEQSLVIFIAFTVTRGLFMYFIYMPLSRKTEKIVEVNSLRWWTVLTFGGIRGPLSILMVLGLSVLVPNYEHLHILEALVFNSVVLVMVVYTPILIITFWLWGDKFKHEYDLEHDNAVNHNLEHN